MTPEAFETHLRNLHQFATPLRLHADRETWRFEFAGKPYYLHFYPQRSRVSASGAPREFAGLKTLQDFKIPAVRVAALMSGFRFGERKGHALIVHGVEPATRLDALPPDPKQHRTIVDQIVAILKKMTQHDVGHAALSLSSFVLHEGKVLVLDAIDIRSEVLTTEQLMQFAHNVEPYATRADRVRVWKALAPDKDIPPDRAKLKRYSRDLNNDAIEKISIGDWSGKFKVRSNESLAFSQASRLTIHAEDWQREWPRLIGQIRADQLDVLKRDRSGDILGAQITLQGLPINAIVKRPRNKFWYRYVLDAFRVSRARRLWDKARWLQVRHIPVEYPLIYMERRSLGYVVESIALFERVPGDTLDKVDLDAMNATEREDFFRDCGRILRRIEDTGLTHTDAKSSNWICFTQHTARGPYPVLIDAYGIRPLNAFLQLFGIRRLLRAMKNHPQYTPEDSLHLCQGFAPRTTPVVEP